MKPTRILTALLFAALAALAAPAFSQGQPQAVQAYTPLTRDTGALITLTAKGASTVVSADQNGYNTSRVYCVFNQVSHTGSPSSTFKIQNKDKASGVYVDVITSGASTADTTPIAISTGAGVPTTSNVSAGLPIGAAWRVSITIAGSATPIITGTVGCRSSNDAPPKTFVANQRARFYTTQKLGEKQLLTPEGFLVITDVPVARVGMQEYHTTEVGLPGDANGIVKVNRTPEEVFKPTHVLSYNGKAIVNDHPDEEKYPDGVTPENYKALTVGAVLNPHQGTGLMADLLLVDFVIMDAAAIADVRSGKREVSCGYDADYNEIAPGEGEQVNLFGNHIALVEAGRCGARCSIGDRKFKLTGDDAMRIRTHDSKLPWLDRLLKAKDGLVAALKTQDAEEIKKAEKEMQDAEAGVNGAVGEEGDHTHLHIHNDATLGGGNAGEGELTPVKMTDEQISGGFKEMKDSMEKLGKTVDAIAKKVGYDASVDAEATEELEGGMADEAPEGMAKDAARKSRDSIFLGDSYQGTAAAAEILVPGIRIPGYDRTADPKKTFKTIDGLRRTALDLMNNTAEGRAMIELVQGGKRLSLDSMKAGEVRTLFMAVGAMKKQYNRDASQRTGDIKLTDGGQRKGVSVADIQAMNEKVRQGKKAA